MRARACTGTPPWHAVMRSRGWCALRYGSQRGAMRRAPSHRGQRLAWQRLENLRTQGCWVCANMLTRTVFVHTWSWGSGTVSSKVTKITYTSMSEENHSVDQPLMNNGNKLCRPIHWSIRPTSTSLSKRGGDGGTGANSSAFRWETATSLTSWQLITELPFRTNNH